MVAVIAGNGLGLLGTSLSQLGQAPGGQAGIGQSGTSQYVNVASGNLVLQSQDERLVTQGLLAGLVRTYNSLGTTGDLGAGGWLLGLDRRLGNLTGTLDTAGSTVTRDGGDGEAEVFAYDAARGVYVASTESGADDTLSWDSGSSTWTYVAGGSRGEETYNAAGTLTGLLDGKSGAGYTLSYDGSNRLAQVTAGDGEALILGYDGSGRVDSLSTLEIPPGGGAAVTASRVTYGYDALGRLSTVTTDLTPADTADSSVFTTTYTYDGTSLRLASLTQSDSVTVSYTYVQDGQGAYRVATVTTGSGAAAQSLSFSYDLVNRETTVTDASGRAWTYTYDAAGNLISVTSPAVNGQRQVTGYTYTAGGHIASMTDAQGHTTVYQYDERGNRLLERDALGNTIAYTYSADDQLLTRTVYRTADPDGDGAAQPSDPSTTWYVYDSNDRLRFVIDADGGVEETQYNAQGQVSLTRTYLGAVYDTGSLSATTAPDLATIGSWAATQDLSETARVDYAYDTAGRLTQRTAWDQVDSAGNGVAEVGESITQYVYDAQGLLRQQVTLRGADRSTRETTAYSYDGLGRLIGSTDATGVTTTYAYQDAQGTLTVTYANGLVRTEVRNSAGELVTVTESAVGETSRTTTYLHDVTGQLRAVQDAGGAIRYTFYDDAGRVSGMVDATGAVTRYVRDADGHVVETTQYATRVDTTGWLSGGAVSGATPTDIAAVAPATASGDRTALAFYDEAGRHVADVDAQGNVITYGYDGAGNAVSSTAHATALTAAQLGALQAAPDWGTLQTDLIASADDRTTFAFYDPANRKVATLDAAGYVTTIAYDAAGHVIKTAAYATGLTASQRAALGASPSLAAVLADLVGSADDQITRSYYDDGGQLVAQVDADGYLTVTAYDATLHRVTTTRHAQALTTAQMSALTGHETVGVLAGLVAGSTSQTRIEDYDADGRLLQATDVDGTVTVYQYDDGGHLHSTTVTPPDGGQVRTTSAIHDAFGDAVSRTDGANATTTTTYNALGQPITSTDALGNTTWYFYDAEGRLAYTVQGQPSGSTLNALGNVTRYSYNAFGQAATTRRFAGQLTLVTSGSSAGTTLNTTTATTADLASAAAALANPATDATTTYTYTLDGQVASATDGRGYQTAYQYDAFNDLVRQQQQLSQPGQALGVGNSVTTAYSYDARGLRTGEVDDAGTGTLNRTTAATYDAFGRVTSRTDARGNVVTYTYDTLGRKVGRSETVQGAVRATQSTYDAYGRVLSETDAMGQVTTYAYDTAHRTMTVTTPDGVAVTTAKDAYGDTLSVTDGASNTTHYTYDGDGRLLTVQDALGNTTTTNAYDAAGHLARTTDATGHVVAYTYDTAGRTLTRIVDPDGLHLVTAYTYDGRGQQVSVTDPTGTLTTYAYDAGGNVLTQVQDAGDATHLNLTTTYAWDGAGRQLSVTEGAGKPEARTTSYVYDALGRRTSTVVDPGTGHLNLTTAYAYDANDNLTQVTDAAGNITRYAYNEANERVYTIDPMGAVTQTWYDADGRVAATRAFAAALTASQLAALGSAPTPAQVAAVVVASDANDAVGYRVYDAGGMLRFVLDGMGSVSETRYDAAGRVDQALAYANPVAIDATLRAKLLAGTASVADIAAALALAGDSDTGARIQRTLYDAAGHARFVLTRGDASNVAYVAEHRYDAAGRLTTEVVYGEAIANYSTALTTLDVSNAVAARSNYRITRYVYDSAGRQRYRIDAGNGVTETRYDAVGRVVETLSYANAIILPAQLTEAGVTSAVTAAGTAGARIATTTYDAAGRIKTTGDALGTNATYTCDAVGNRLTYANRDGATWTYVYDVAGRRTEEHSPSVKFVNVDAAGNVTTVTQSIVTRLTYDALGNVVSRTEAYGTSAARTTTYVYDARGRQVRTIYPDAGKIDPATGNLVAAGSTPSSQVWYDALDRAVVSLDVNNHYSYKAYDTDGRLRFDIDANGDVTEYRYDAYGDQTTLIRYANALDVSGWAAGRAFTVADVQARLSPSSQDRVLTSAYDSSGNKISVQQTSVSYFVGNGQYTAAGQPTTNYVYDAFGEVVRESVQVGPSAWANTYHYYDALGRKTMDVDPVGYVTTWAYDAQGDVTQTVEYARAIATGSLSVDTPPTLPAPGDASTGYDRITTYSYDAVGRKHSETTFRHYGLADGSAAMGSLVTAYAYDGEGRIVDVKVTDPLTGTTTTVAHTQYDVLGRSTGLTEAARQVVVSTWQSALQTSSQTTLDSSTLYRTVSPYTTFEYDALGNAIRVTRFINGSGGTAADTGNQVTVTRYDHMGRVVDNKDAAGTHRYTAYDAAGHTTQAWYTLAGNGGQSTTVTATYTYDATGRQLTTQVSRSGQSLPDSAQQVRYNAFGEIIAKGASTDAGIATSALPAQYVYDAAGRLIGASDDKTGATHLYAYDLAGRLIADSVKIGSSGNPPQPVYATTLNTLDLNGRVVQQALPRNSDSGGSLYLNKRYDRWGNVVELIDPRGYSTQYFYDDKNNLIREVQPLAKIVNASNQEVWAHPEQRWSYDALGRLIRAQDANGHVRSYAYDAAGQQVTYTDATGSVTRSAYDTLGRQVAQQNAIGHITFQDFDALDRVAAHGDFLVASTGTTRSKSTQESYLLDQNGDRIKVTDALGHAMLYDYDSQQRLLSSTTPTGVHKTYTYDAQGHKTAEATGLGSDQEAWTYDYFGRVQTHTDLGGVQTTYTYGVDSGLLIGESNTAGGNRTTSYYDNGQVKQITEGANAYIYKYDASGNRVWEETNTTDGGGKVVHVRTQSVYDSLNRLVHVVSDDLVTNTRTLDLAYGYDAVGNRRYVRAQSGYGSNVTPISTANDNPVITAAPAARTLRADWVGSFSLLASDIFRDPEGGVLTYSAQLQGGGALPSWLHFSYDATTGSLVFTTTTGSAAMLGQDLVIVLVATDAGGKQSGADFTLRVRDNTAPQAATVDASALTFHVKTDRDFAAELAASTYFFDEDIGDTVAIDVASITPAASWLTVDTSNPSVVRLSGHPDSGASNTYTLTLRGTDQRGATVTRTVTLIVAPNSAPTPKPVANIAVVGGRTLQWLSPLSSVFVDPEGEQLSISARLTDGSALPPWLTFQYLSNQSLPSLVLSGQVPASEVGHTYSITLTARDPDGAASVNTFTLSVTANSAPQAIGSIAALSGRATVAYSHQFSAPLLFQDANGDPMSFYVLQADGTDLPAWLKCSVDASGHVTLSGTPPANAQSVDYNLKLHARDIDGLEGTIAFVLHIGGETPPAYTSGSIDASQVIYPGRQFTLTVPAGAFTDPDGDTLTYSASSWSATRESDPVGWTYDYSPLPSWLTFNAATRTLSGVVPVGVVAGDTFKIRISADDGIYQFNDDSVQWSNTAYLTLTAQQFVGSPPIYNGGLSNRSANQGDSVSYALPTGTFTEPDGDAMTYSAQVEIPAFTYEKWNDSHTEIVEVPHSATWVALSQVGLSIDPATGRIYGTAQTLDYDTGLGGIVHDGSYRIKLIATDPQGNANTPDAIFALSVNQKPNAPASLSYNAGVHVAFSYPVPGFSDPEGAALSYTAKLGDGSALPAWLSITSAGVLGGTPPTTGTWSIRITAADPAGLSASTTLTLTSANNPPVYHAGTLTNQSAIRGASWTYGIPAGAFTDPNGDTLTYTAYQVVSGSYKALPSWLNFNGTGGTFSGVFPDGNAIQLAIVATDPSGSSTPIGAATFTVTPVNVAPMYNGTLSDQPAHPSQAFSYTFAANTFTDANGDALTYTALQSGGAALPAWLSFNAATRTFSGTPTAAGTWTIQLTAADPDGASASATFKITTENAPPAVANAIPNQTAQPSQAFSYTVPANTFSDANNDPLTYAATLSDGSALPSWLSFNAATRTFSGTGVAAGSWTIKVSATDTSGLTAATTFVVTVPQVAPQYNNTLSNQTAYGSQAFSYTIAANTFTDPNGGAVTYSALQNDGTALPSWLVFNASTRTFSGTSVAVGSWVIRVVGTDPAGLATAATFTIATPNSAPVVANAIPNQTATPGAYTYAYQVPANTFWDANGDGLTYAATLSNGSALPSWMSFNAATRTVSFWAGGKGAWTLRITATDSHGAAASTTFTITLPDVAPTYNGGYANPSWTIGQSVNLPVPTGAFTDANNDALSYTGYVYIPAHTYSTWDSTHTEILDHDVAAQWASLSQVGLSINASTGAITGTASTLDYQEDWDVVRHTGYTIQVVASDPAGHSAAVNLSATANYAPPALVSAIPDATVNPGQGWTQVVPTGVFSDPYGQGLALSAKLSSGAALPAGLSWSGSSVNVGAVASGNYAIVVTATDGLGRTASDTFTLTVNNQPPVFGGAPTNLTLVQNAAMTAYTAPAATDANGDAITYSASNLPPGIAFNATTRTFSGTPTSTGTWTVSYKATDAKGAVTTATFAITVNAPVSQPPVYNGGIPATVNMDVSLGSPDSYTFPATAFTSPAGLALTYSALQSSGSALPSWLTFNAGTRTFSASVAKVDHTATVTLKATDTQGRSASDTFNIYVLGTGSVSNLSATLGGPGQSAHGADAPGRSGSAGNPNDTATATTTQATTEAVTTTPNVQEYWFTYDAENRTQIVNGTLVGDQVQSSGDSKSYEQLYDAVGNVVQHVTSAGGVTYVQRYDYDERNQKTHDWYKAQVGTAGEGIATSYGYDADGRAVDVRDYYGASATGTWTQNGDGTFTFSMGGFLRHAEETAYDADGRVVSVTDYGRDGTVDWEQSVGRKLDGGGGTEDAQRTDLSVLSALSQVSYAKLDGTSGYDAAGNLTDYTYQVLGTESGIYPNGMLPGQREVYHTGYLKRDGYLTQTVGGTSPDNPDLRATTATTGYDAFGRTLSVTEHTTYSTPIDDRVRYFGADADGEILSRRDGTIDHTTGQFTQTAGGADPAAQTFHTVFAGGERVATLTENGDINVADLLTGYDAGGSSGYVVQSGDTLAGIAQKVYGNGSLWYVVADANALEGDADLVAGVQLKLPQVAVNSNDAHTFKPYSPAESIGSQTPSLPNIAPPPSQHCNTLAMIVIIAVVIVATVFTAGAALAAMAPGAAASAATAVGATAGTVEATMAAGAAVITGGAGLSGAVAAAAFAGGVVGSVAGQLTGKALGVQDHFSLREAFATGLTTAATAGIGSAISGGKTAAELAKLGDYGKIAATGVASYGAGYAADRIAGLDAHFSWAGVAASAVASVVSSKLSSEELGALHLDANSVTGDFVQGFTGDVVGVHTRRKFGFDDRIDYGAMATDAFGNALGNEVARVHAYRKSVEQQREQRVAQLTPAQQVTLDVVKELGGNDRQGLTTAELFTKVTDRPLDAEHPTFSVETAPEGEYSSAQIDAFWAVLSQKATVDNFGAVFADARDVANLVPIRDRVNVLGDMLAGMSTTDPSYAEMKQLHDVMTDALLAKDVYYDHSIPGLLPEGITRIESAQELQKLFLTPAMLNDPKSGYFAAVYRNDATGGYIVADRGTEDGRDWGTNFRQGIGLDAEQYNEAAAVARAINSATSDVTFTGHSLGGGLAALQALVAIRPAVTFNAAGLNQETAAREGVHLSQAKGLISAYHVDGELLTTLNRLPILPAADGMRYALPAVSLPDSYSPVEQPLPFIEHMSPYVMFELHGMTEVLHALNYRMSQMLGSGQ